MIQKKGQIACHSQHSHHSGPFRPFTIQNHTLLIRLQYNCSGPFRAIQGHSGPFRAIQGHSRPFKAIQEHSGAFRSIQEHSGAFRTICVNGVNVAPYFGSRYTLIALFLLQDILVTAKDRSRLFRTLSAPGSP